MSWAKHFNNKNEGTSMSSTYTNGSVYGTYYGRGTATRNHLEDIFPGIKERKDPHSYNIILCWQENEVSISNEAVDDFDVNYVSNALASIGYTRNAGLHVKYLEDQEREYKEGQRALYEKPANDPLVTNAFKLGFDGIKKPGLLSKVKASLPKTRRQKERRMLGDK